MPKYIEYDLEDGATILIESSDEETQIVKAACGDGNIAKTKAQMGFGEALRDIKMQAKVLINEIEGLHVDEAEVKFGINTIGELGNLAIGKIGIGVNYEVTLRWSKSSKKNK